MRSAMKISYGYGALSLFQAGLAGYCMGQERWLAASLYTVAAIGFWVASHFRSKVEALEATS